MYIILLFYVLLIVLGVMSVRPAIVGSDYGFSASFHPWMSPSSKGSPHSGQNLGGWAGSSGSQPHLSHLYCGTPAGLGLPHSAQNFPLFTAPQEQVQPFVSAGLGFPHSGQNFPVAVAPQEQVQLSPAGLGTGLGAPHPAQNLPVFPVCPQEHAHPSMAGAAGAGCCTDCC